MGKSLNLESKRFEKLSVIKRLENSKDGKTVWLCRCDCGKEVEVLGTELATKRKKSCGCFQNKLISMLKTKHGATNTAEFKAWSSMKERCLCKSNKAFKNYGGRNIKICEKWVESFENFLKDMGVKPSKNHSLDRIDNEGDYTPENCRWATKEEQNRNKRTKTNPKTNYKGIFFRKSKYEVRICVDKKRLHIGSFNTLEEAKEARIKAEEKYWK